MSSDKTPESGISLTLATERARTIEDIRYELSFDIPATSTEPVSGLVWIRFNLKDVSRPLVLDFAAGRDHLTSLSATFRLINGHIVIPKEELVAGQNAIRIEFLAGGASIHRNSDFLYTLFVPARAHLAFPCFDQPDLKARFTLELTIPGHWEAVGNSGENARETSGDRVRIRYSETPPIPTYLFAFAAGNFQIETAERNGRRYRMFHRESDADSLRHNRETLFDLHALSLDWLEKYTAVPYPFGKFDFVLIPSFPFRGMEHPGCVFYNAASLLLDEAVTENRILGRASLIAHETAHMWFGDLVTMQWFNDVWMKEVFANFMAAKIVNPWFPDLDHDLRFLVAHYPPAYAVDRTMGAHPIRQALANLDDAGSLYGAIIYQKAPIMMRQLERALGTARFREGVRRYLKQFAFGNAAWPDLIRILSEYTDLDLAAWSQAWIEEAGRPEVFTELDVGSDGTLKNLAFIHTGRILRQQVEIVVGGPERAVAIPMELAARKSDVPDAHLLPRPDFVLPTGGGLAYGAFKLDNASREFLLQHGSKLDSAVTRAAAWITLWEEMLDGRVAASHLLEAFSRALPLEDTEQNVELILCYAADLFWRFLSDATRRLLATPLEGTLYSGMMNTISSRSMQLTYFSAFRSVVITADGTALLEQVWRRLHHIPDLAPGEDDEATTAMELAVRQVPEANAILEEQHARLVKADRRKRFEFVMPALSARQETRDAVFESLLDVENRRQEPWVIEALRYLNHPLRSGSSLKYLEPGLNVLEEIQRTGDIFFPKNWMEALLSGHNTPGAARIVRDFLAARPGYPDHLRQIILQAADSLFRSSNLLSK